MRHLKDMTPDDLRNLALRMKALQDRMLRDDPMSVMGGDPDDLFDAETVLLDIAKERSGCNCELKPMSIDEAIEHCKTKEDMTSCGMAHRQLRKWLEELKTIKDNGCRMMSKFKNHRAAWDYYKANVTLCSRDNIGDFLRDMHCFLRWLFMDEKQSKKVYGGDLEFTEDQDV